MEELAKQNPFHCFLSANVVLQAVFILGGNEENFASIPQDLHQPIRHLISEIRSLLESYHHQGAGSSVEDLIKIIFLEADIVHKMLTFSASSCMTNTD